MEPRNLNRHFATLRAAAGLPDVRLHDFRHTVVSLSPFHRESRSTSVAWRTRMACTIAVARRGQQRSLVRTFQPLRVAMARSPIPRVRAWDRLTAFVGWIAGVAAGGV